MYSEEENQFMALAAKFRGELSDIDKKMDALTTRRNELLHLLHGEHTEVESEEAEDLASNDLFFTTAQDARLVLEALGNVIREHGYATVADLHELSGFTSTYADSKLGWRTTEGAIMSPRKEGFRLRLPKPDQIEHEDEEETPSYDSSLVDKTLVRFIEKNPGVKRAEIEKALSRFDSGDIERSLRRCRTAGLIISEGRSRGAVWYKTQES